MSVLTRRVVPFTLAILTCASCSREPSSITLSQSSIAIHSILWARSSTAAVLLTSNEPNLTVNPLPGALITLQRSGKTFALVNGNIAACHGISGTLLQGCYGADLGSPINAGDSLDLDVRTGGLLVHGTTTVPNPVLILSPDSGSVLSLACASEDECAGSLPGSGVLGSIGLSIHADTTVRRIEIITIASDEAKGECVVELLTPNFIEEPARTTSIDLRVLGVQCSRAWREVRLSVTLAGFNKSYADYMDRIRGNALDSDSASFGIKGVPGVFAGAGKASITLRVLKKQ
jgi:hypothetical protein